MKSALHEFAAQSRGARKVLVMELAGLGDNVHLLPALWLARQHYADTELHVMASAHGAELFKLTPWVDGIWAYPRLPHPPNLWGTLQWGQRLRREHFDVVINTTGSDRSSLLTRITGAKLRAGRRPADGGPPGWDHLFTHVVEQPYYSEAMYWQKWHCLRQLGFAGAEPEFHIDIDTSLRAVNGIGAEHEKRYLHLSPFTSSDRKELPETQLIEVLEALHRRFPDRPVAISCAPSERERDKLKQLLAQLSFAPRHLFPGTLDVAALTSVIQGAALHLGGDSGGLHLAYIAGTPAVIWYREHGGRLEWTLPGNRHRLLVSDPGGAARLTGIATSEILDTAQDLLREAAA